MQKGKFAKTAMIVGMLTALSVALYLGGATVNQGAFAAKKPRERTMYLNLVPPRSKRVA
jgi:hypothetical protein